MNTRSNILIVVLVVLSTFGTIFTLFFGEKFSTHESYRNDVYSYSALGHRGFRSLLEEKFKKVELSLNDSRRYDLLFLIEPNIDNEADEYQEILGRCMTCVLVLPKRFGLPDEDQNHISKHGFVEERKVSPILEQFLINSENLSIQRSQKSSITINLLQVDPPVRFDPVQVVTGVDDEMVILGTEKGALIFYEEGVEGRRIVISDPDILANHGIDEVENQAYFNAFFDAELGDFLGEGGGTIAIDETLHGYRQAPSLLRLLTTFPLSIFTIQLLLMLLIVTWRGLLFFGSANIKATRIKLGAHTLIENTASLFSPSHAVYIGNAYSLAAMKDVGESLNAPRELTQKELIEWLDESNLASGVEFRISRVLDDFAEFELEIKKWTPKDIVAIVQEVDAWRNRVTNE